MFYQSFKSLTLQSVPLFDLQVVTLTSINYMAQSKHSLLLPLPLPTPKKHIHMTFCNVLKSLNSLGSKRGSQLGELKNKSAKNDSSVFIWPVSESFLEGFLDLK